MIYGMSITFVGNRRIEPSENSMKNNTKEAWLANALHI